MGGRDHSCEHCGRGGFNDPDGRCECGELHLRFLWEQNARELADDPNYTGDTEGWIRDLEASARLVGRDLWDFLRTDSEVTEFELHRLEATRSPTETKEVPDA
jgi:hypothetical protein